LAASNQFSLSNQTDVFVVSSDGATKVSWVQGAGKWQGPLAITTTGLTSPGGGVAASNQFSLPNQTDVFVVANDGATRVSWVQSGGKWQGPLTITPAGLAPKGAHLAASNQFGIPNQTDVFVVANDGATRVSWVQSGGKWQGSLTISTPELGSPGAGLAASNQFGLTQTDVFQVDPIGTNQVIWVQGGGLWQGPLAI
jgi:hypothetical protein